MLHQFTGGDFPAQVELPWKPRPSFAEVQWSGAFYAFDAQNEYSQENGLSIRLLGWDDLSRVVSVRVSAPQPYFYCRTTDSATLSTETLRSALNAALSSRPELLSYSGRSELSAKQRWQLEDVVRRGAVVDVSRIEGRDADEPFASKGDPVRTFYRVICRHPDVMRGCANAALQRAIPNLPKSGETLLLFESELDFNVRALADAEFALCTWMQISEQCRVEAMENYQARLDTSRADLSRPSEIALSARAKFGDFQRHPTLQILPKLRKLSCDIEAIGANSQFPQAWRDRVNTICFYLSETYAAEADTASGFAMMTVTADDLRESEEPLREVPADASQVLIFDSEAAMLASFREIVLQADPDIIAAHNGNGFDLLYLLGRAESLAKNRACSKPLRDVMADFASLGRVDASVKAGAAKRGNLRVVQGKGVRKNRRVFSASVEGRLIFDTLILAMEIPGNPDVRLGIQAARYLGSDLCKDDLSIAQMVQMQRGADGRHKILRYCLRDALIVDELLKYHKSVEVKCSMATSCGLSVQPLLNRGAMAQTDSRLICELSKPVRVSEEDYDSERPEVLVRLASAKAILPDASFDRRRRASFDRRPFFTEFELDEDDLERGDAKKKAKTKTKARGGMVFEPEIGYYSEPVATFDAASLYPSVMRSFNLCKSTLLTLNKAQELGLREGIDFHRSPGWDADFANPDVVGEAERPCFLTSSACPGKNSAIVTQLLEARALVREEMREKQAKLDESDRLTEKRFQLEIASLDAQQLTTKALCNAVYGTQLQNRSKLYNFIAASCVPRAGRDALQCMSDHGLRDIREHYPLLKTLYGDTDSIFLKLGTLGLDLKSIVAVFHSVRTAINAYFRSICRKGQPPVTVKLEKIFLELVITKKKNYIGRYIDMEALDPDCDIESAPQKIHISGVRFKKGDATPFTQALGEKISRCFFEDRSDASTRLKRAVTEIRKTINCLMRHEISPSMLVTHSSIGYSILDRLEQGAEIDWRSQSVLREAQRQSSAAKQRGEFREEIAGMDRDTLENYSQGAMVHSIRRAPLHSGEKVRDRLESPLYFVENQLEPDWVHYFNDMFRMLNNAFSPVFDALSGQRGYLTELQRRNSGLVGNAAENAPMHRFIIDVTCPACPGNHGCHARMSASDREQHARWFRRNIVARDYCIEECFSGRGGGDIEDCSSFTCVQWGERKLSETMMRSHQKRLQRYCQK